MSIPFKPLVAAALVVMLSACASSHVLTGRARAPIDPKIHLCAGPDDPKRPANTCKGDSGGPLVWIDPANRPRLVGIVSWGTCGIGVPAIYTDVRAHLDWIERARAAPGGRI